MIRALKILWLTSGISLWTILAICITVNIGYGSSKIEYFKNSKSQDNKTFEYINIIFKCIFFTFYYSFLQRIIISYWKTYLRIVMTILKKKSNNIEIVIFLLILLILMITILINLKGFFFTFQWLIVFYTGTGFLCIFSKNFFSKYKQLKKHLNVIKMKKKIDIYKYNKYTYCTANGMESGKLYINYIFNLLYYFSFYIILALIFNHKFYAALNCLIIIIIFYVIFKIRLYWIDLNIIFFNIYFFYYKIFCNISNFFCRIFCNNTPDALFEEIGNKQIELKENIINYFNITPDVISIELEKQIELEKNIIKENDNKNKYLLEILNIYFNNNKNKSETETNNKKNKNSKRKKRSNNKSLESLKNIQNIPTTKNPIKREVNNENFIIKRINEKEIN